MLDCCFLQYIIPVALVLCYILRKWLNGGTCRSTARLDGKTVLITGANSGIGKETAVDMATRGATVIMACRDMKRSEPVLKEVRAESGSSKVFLMKLDLASLQSIREFVTAFLASYDKLHILINNAGLFSNSFKTTVDGFELNTGVNHFGHFALTNLILERIVQSVPSRIVNIASDAYKMADKSIDPEKLHLEENFVKGILGYGKSKLCNILFTSELARKLEGTGVTTYSLMPGVIGTNIFSNYEFKNKLHESIFRFFGFFLFKSLKQGAQTSIYCAVEENIENKSGLYFKDCAVKELDSYAKDAGMAKKLWEYSEEKTFVKYPL